MSGRGLRFVTRIDAAVHGLRARWGRWAGRVPTVVPFIGYGGDGWIRVLGRVVLRKPGRAPADRFTSVRGWRSFTSIPVRDAVVTVTANDTTGQVHGDPGGVIDARFEVRLPPGWSSVRLSIEGHDGVDFPVFVVDEAATFGVVSDVDDTVMVTALPRPFLAAWNSFVLDEHARTPVAGMAVLYERLVRANPDAPVVYLSTGAWNVVPTLTRFLGRNLYPRGPLLLTAGSAAGPSTSASVSSASQASSRASAGC